MNSSSRQTQIARSQSDSFIPYPHLESYMQKRIPLPKKTWAEELARYAEQPLIVQQLHAVVSRLYRILKKSRLISKWTIYRISMSFLNLYYRIVRGMQIHGEKNIPKEGGIYLINHMAGIDVVIPFLAAFKKPIGVFTDMGNHFVVDILEKVGFVPRMGSAPEMVEKMIRSLLCKNRNFVMWPEGTPDKGKGVMQGFSSIVKVYATVNFDKDRVPFVPVVMQGIDKLGEQYIPNIRRYCPKWDTLTKSQRRKVYRKIKREGVRRVIFTYLPPIYLPREWLSLPKEGGKTPREIIDFLMLKIANKMGQKTLAPNPLLDERKAGNRTTWH